MIAKDKINTDDFMDMPMAARLLYYDLNMRADDDGFLGNAKAIARMIGANSDDLKVLADKNFIISFDDHGLNSGVVVISHWKQHNYIKKDRYNPTIHQNEKKLLHEIEGCYYLKHGTGMEPEWGQDGTGMEPEWNQHGTGMGAPGLGLGLGLGLDIKDKPLGGGRENKPKNFPKKDKEKTADIRNNYVFSDSLGDAVDNFLQYKTEKNLAYKPTGLKSLLNKIQKNAADFGENAVIDAINNCMSNNWQGIVWDQIKTKGGKVYEFGGSNSGRNANNEPDEYACITSTKI